MFWFIFIIVLLDSIISQNRCYKIIYIKYNKICVLLVKKIASFGNDGAPVHCNEANGPRAATDNTGIAGWQPIEHNKSFITCFGFQFYW